MSDIFISYARSTEPAAKRIAEALRGLGYGVWRDDELPAHRAYAEVIEERLRDAKAVVVLWSAEAVKSQWVQSEADRAREDGKLVQLNLDGTRLPMPFDRIQCADLTDWAGEANAPGWRKAVSSIAELIGKRAPTPEAAAANAPLPLPGKPSIAVLPFANLSGDPEQDYFADGMVEEIVTALSRFSSLFVIASGSSLTFRGDAHTSLAITRELGVRYLVHGSVRRSGARVRIAAQVVDMREGGQIWAETFDGVMDDIFTVQDEIARAIASQVEPSVTAAEIRRSLRQPATDLSAYDFYLRARHQFGLGTTASIGEAISLIDKAIGLDADFAPALALGSLVWGLRSLGSAGADPDAPRKRSLELGRAALVQGPDDPEVLAMVSTIFVLLGEDMTVFRRVADRAVALNPGSSLAWFARGSAKLCAGETAEALTDLETGLRLDPRSPWRVNFRLFIGDCLFMASRFDEAISAYRECLQVDPDSWGALTMVAASHAQAGRLSEARDALPKLAPAFFRQAIAFFRDPKNRDLLSSGLALAGAEF